MPKEKKKTEKVIKKKTRVSVSNTLNQMIFEQKDMNLQAFRMVMFYLAKINPERPDFTEVKVPLETYAEMLGVELNEQAIDASTDLLMGYVVKTGEIDAGEYIIRNAKYSVFSVCRLMERKSDGKKMLEFKCSDDIKPLIFEMKEKFTAFSVWNVLNLSNFQDIRMYMLLAQHRVAGRKTFTVEELKDKLGIGKEAYPEYKIFARAVLKKCQKALKERTDICFEFKAVGRPAHSVYFEISANKEYTILKYLEEKKEPAQLSAPDDEFGEQITVLPSEDALITKLAEYDEERTPEQKILDFFRTALTDSSSLTDEQLDECVTLAKESSWCTSWRFVCDLDELNERLRDYLKRQDKYTRANYNDSYYGYMRLACRDNYAGVAEYVSSTEEQQGSFDVDEFYEVALKRTYDSFGEKE